MFFTVLIVLMDEAYANQQEKDGYHKERETLNLVNEIIPQFEPFYDRIIDLRDWPSVTELDREKRINELENQLLTVKSILDSLDKGEKRSLYLHFVGHGGHDDKIDEIQHLHYDVLFPMIEKFFCEYEININLLGTCQSKYAMCYMKRGTLLCCSKSTMDILSPFQYTTRGYYETGDFEEFIRNCGNSGGYERIIIP